MARLLLALCFFAALVSCGGANSEAVTPNSFGTVGLTQTAGDPSSALPSVFDG